MKAPKFWQDGGFIAEALLPFSLLYFLFSWLRGRSAETTELGIPVICVGNITAGGAGKTPTAIAIGRLLKKKKIKFAFVTKGYLGRVRKPTKVDPKKHTLLDVGDEALLLAREGVCWVGKSRIETTRAAIKNGARLIVLDDGMQDPSLKKDLTLLVIDGTYGLGNGFVIPAGPLRVRSDKGVQNCDAVIMIGKDKKETGKFIRKFDRQIIRASFKPTMKIDRKEKYLAFAGIGNPQKFSDTLQDMGAKISLALAYPDHHHYTMLDIRNLRKRAKELEARLITTEKDAVRLPEDFRKEVVVVPVELEFEKESRITDLLGKVINK